MINFYSAALVLSGISVGNSTTLAAQVNRFSRHYTQLSLGTYVSNIIQHIPMALEEILKSPEGNHE